MSTKLKDTLLIIDGSSYLYRAFYGLPDLATSKGQPTGAIYGVINMLLNLLREQQPKYIVVVFDAKGKTFRNEIFQEYKANRPKMPEELAAQVQPLFRLIKAMGLYLTQVPGVEADDVIGTITKQGENKNMNIFISTGDKDITQLVTENVTIIDTMKNTTLDTSGVKKKFGVEPYLITDYLALMGDKADNIPGVPGIGPKTAATLLEKYKSLSGVIKNAADIQGKVGESLRNCLEIIPIAHKLASIKCDVELSFSIEDLKIQQQDNATLAKLLKEYEFKNLLKIINEWDTEKQNTEIELKETEDITNVRKGKYSTIYTKKDLNMLIHDLKKSKIFSFDTETTSLSYLNAEIVGLSFSAHPGVAAYVPLKHDYAGAPEQLDRNYVLEILRPILESDAILKVGHNLKYDKHVLANHDINLQGIAHDSMLQSYVFNSTAVRHNLDRVSEKYLSYKTVTFENIAGKGVKQLTFNQIDIEEASPYAAEDADLSFTLHNYFLPRLQKHKKLTHVYEKIEIPLLTVLAEIERKGVLIDPDVLKKQSQGLAKEINSLESESFRTAGCKFNLASPKQIREILFDKLELPVIKKTSTGFPSTAEDVLQELAQDYELPAIILKHRTLNKLKSTYTDKLPTQINVSSGRVHTSYHQALTATGRLSSSDPNLQNIPIRTDTGRKIRQAFISSPGYCLLASDYSQIELRIMAHLSGDNSLCTAFLEGSDVHCKTASEVFSVALDKVTKQQRRAAKAINFGLIYGMSAFGLAKQLGIDRTSASEYIDLYFKKYPGVKIFMDKTKEQARDQGYVETIFGRRLHVPDINSKNTQRRQYAERTAINAPMQGTAADIIKLAMLDINAWLKKEKLDMFMIMQVHDELVFEVNEKIINTVIEGVNQRMRDVVKLAVPLEVESCYGANWEEAH